MYLPEYNHDGITDTGYTVYKVNGVSPSSLGYKYPASGWDNGNFVLEIEALGDSCVVHGKKHENLNNGQAWSNWHDIVPDRAIDCKTITSFEWGLFNRVVMPGSVFKIYGVRA